MRGLLRGLLLGWRYAEFMRDGYAPHWVLVAEPLPPARFWLARWWRDIRYLSARRPRGDESPRFWLPALLPRTAPANAPDCVRFAARRLDAISVQLRSGRWPEDRFAETVELVGMTTRRMGRVSLCRKDIEAAVARDRMYFQLRAETWRAEYAQEWAAAQARTAAGRAAEGGGFYAAALDGGTQ